MALAWSSLVERRNLQNEIPVATSRDGNTSVTATAIIEHEVTVVDPDSSSVVLVSYLEQSSASLPVPTSGTNDATRLKHDSAMDMDVPKVPAAGSTMVTNYIYSYREPNGRGGNSWVPQASRDGRQARIELLEQELENARKEYRGFRNENAKLKQTIHEYARDTTKLEHDLQTDRCKWKNDADRHQTEIEGFRQEIANLNQAIGKYAHDTATLEHHLKSERDKMERVVKDFNLLQHNNSELERGYADLQRKLDKKNRSYKEMAKNYMDQIRPTRVSDDDTSAIYNRLTQIQVSIEQLIQRARGDRFANLNKDVALEYFKDSELFAGMADLELELSAYHLDLCMESAVMSTLVHHFFQRPLGCIFEHSEEFEGIYSWVSGRDNKIGDRWRQQLYTMVLQDPSIEARRQQKVNYAAEALSEMVSLVYPNVDMFVNITELCDKAFELAIATFGCEYVIFPIPTPPGMPFDEETMAVPQKSNPAGTVTLVIFPAFGDNGSTSNMKAKVWCH